MIRYSIVPKGYQLWPPVQESGGWISCTLGYYRDAVETSEWLEHERICPHCGRFTIEVLTTAPPKCPHCWGTLAN